MKSLYTALIGLCMTTYAIASPADTTSPIVLVPMFIILIALTYFVRIRPKNAQNRHIQKILAQLEIGKTVKLSCGIIGKITAIQPQELHLHIANDTVIRVDKQAVTAILPPHDITVTTLIEE